VGLIHPVAAALDAARLGPVARELGFVVRDWDAMRQEITIDFTVDARWCNGLGRVQGGIVCALLDLCCTSAGLCATELKRLVPTLELKTSFVAPVCPGAVVGRGRVLRLGRRVAFLEARLEDLRGTLLTTASATALPVLVVPGGGP
jgi:uncharacterized protein (TIGR00369 family)